VAGFRRLDLSDKRALARRDDAVSDGEAEPTIAWSDGGTSVN
jgi:hypothetical protein